jgi:hypothetical protein
MAGLVPAIHVFFAEKLQGRGCPAPVYAKASTGSVSVRRSFSEGGHKAGHDEFRYKALFHWLHFESDSKERALPAAPCASRCGQAAAPQG